MYKYKLEKHLQRQQFLFRKTIAVSLEVMTRVAI